MNSALLTAIDNRAGVAPPTTTVPAGPVGPDVVWAGLDAIGEVGEADELLEGELGGGLDATAGDEPGGGVTTGDSLGEFGGTA